MNRQHSDVFPSHFRNALEHAEQTKGLQHGEDAGVCDGDGEKRENRDECLEEALAVREVSTRPEAEDFHNLLQKRAFIGEVNE